MVARAPRSAGDDPGRAARSEGRADATASLNAQQALIYKTRRTSDYIARTQALTDLQEALGLADAPLRIECYDVSHLSGTNVVASMVVFEDGLPRKDQYRSFSSPRRPTTPTRCIRCSPAVLPISTARRARHHGSDSRTAGPARLTTTRRHGAPSPAIRLPPQLLVVDGGKPAGRGRRASTAGVRS